jgi:hypothetical protein
MIKHLVHIVKVTRSNEKIQFQIKLPRNAKRIVGLKITANPLIKLIPKIAPNYQVEAGWIWLRIPEKRDVFYAESVRRPLPLHSQTILNHTPIGDFDQGSYWTHGTKEEFYSVDASLSTNVVEGFYIDRIHTEGETKEYVEQMAQKMAVESQPKQQRPKEEKQVPVPKIPPLPEQPKVPPHPPKPSPGDRIGYEVRIYLKLEI